MAQRRKIVRMIVTVSAPMKMPNREAIGEARLQLANGLVAFGRSDVKLVSAKPLPVDGFVKPLRPRASRETLPLIDYINQEKTR